MIYKISAEVIFVIGIEEQNGTPVLPPYGLNKSELDAIQKKLVELCHKFQPHYLPLIYPAIYKGKHILIIRAPAGDLRPYRVPKSLGDKNQTNAPYIRFSSKTIEAKGDFLRQLEELTARIPYDDRINQKASIDDLSLSLIRSHLQQTKSSLFEESHQIPFPELCRQMEIAKGDVEELRPLNIGLLFFCEDPWKFIPKSEINFTMHKDLVGRDFTEKIFNGPIQQQLKNALDFIKTNVIEEGVSKVENKAEAERFYNYPYLAVEEVLANAVYHKGYDQRSPIEVQIFPYDRIEVISYPGPMPPIDNEALKKERITSRNYRNRRIGDFLKELKLTEGKATGFPLIYNEMRKNGSHGPEFYTDKDRTLFQAILYVHPRFKHTEEKKPHGGTKMTPGRIQDGYEKVQSWNQANKMDFRTLEDVDALLSFLLEQNKDQVDDQVHKIIEKLHKRTYDQVNDQVSDQVKTILNYCSGQSRKSKEILNKLGYKSHTDTFNRILKPLIRLDWLAYTIPDKPKSSNQEYFTTEKGKLLVKML